MLPGLDLSLRPTVAPGLVVANRLLGCPRLELPQYLLVEAADTPALQLLSAPNCPRCGFPLIQDRCALCRRRVGAWPPPPDDWEERLSAPADFRHEVLHQARLVLDRADHALAEFIIAALDEHGLLPGEVTATLPQRAERVLRVIQSLEPPGIAARDTAECLRLQVQRLTLPVPPAVHRLIERWPNLPEHHAALARALQVTPEELDEAIAFMQKHLRPYPVLESPESLPYRQVDVAIVPARDASASLEVIVAPGPRVRAGDDPATLGYADLSPQDWRILAQHGQLLNRALAWREQIIEQIFDEIARQQEAFLLKGPPYHRPLTRAQVAQAVGVHASTVGRAIAGKTVLIPSGQVLPATIFFERGAAIKYSIKNIVAQATIPLTDEQLRQRLAEQGILIARRTVAKYRAAAGVLPVHLQWEKAR